MQKRKKKEKEKEKRKRKRKAAVTHCKKSLTDVAAKHEEKRAKMTKGHKAISCDKLRL